MTEPKKKLRKPEWDTPEQKAARMRNRRKEQKSFAISHGFTSWESLVTAILRGRVRIVRVDVEKP